MPIPLMILGKRKIFGFNVTDVVMSMFGPFQMDIVAARSGNAVTSVLFWDGPEDYVTHYDFTAPDTTPYCNCCDDPVPTAVSIL